MIIKNQNPEQTDTWGCRNYMEGAPVSSKLSLNGISSCFGIDFCFDLQFFGKSDTHKRTGPLTWDPGDLVSDPDRHTVRSQRRSVLSRNFATHSTRKSKLFLGSQLLSISERVKK